MSLLLLLRASASSQTTVLPLVTLTPSVFSPSVSTRKLDMNLVTNAPTVFAPVVTLSSITSMTDTWTGTNGDPWPTQWVTAASGTGAVADIQSNKGRMATGTVANGRVAARNAASFLPQNYTITADITIPTFTEWYFFVHLRGAGSFVNTFLMPSSYQIAFTVTSSAFYAIELWEVDASGGATYKATGVLSGSPVAGDTVRMMIEVSGTTTLKQKAWKVGISEPAYTDLSSGITTAYSGRYFALSVLGGADTTSEDFLWDNFSAIALAQTVAMDLVAAAPTVFAPTVSYTINTALPLVTNTPTVFSPAVSQTQVVTMAARVLNPPTVFSPTVLATQTVVMPFVVNISNPFNPTVSYTINTALPLVTSAPTVFSPAVGIATQTVAVPLVYMTTSDMILDENNLPILDENGQPIRDGTAGAFSPTATLVNISIAMSLVTNAPSVFSPSVSATSQTAVLPFVTNPPSVFSPKTTYAIAMALVTNTQTVFSATISTGSLTVTAPLVTNAPTVFAPLILGTQIVSPPLVTSAPTVFSPLVAPVQPVVLPLVTSAPTVFSPAITTGGLSIVMLRIVNTPTVFAPTINPLNQIVTIDLVLNSPTTFALRVVERSYIFEPPHDELGPRKLSEYGRRRQGVTRTANDLAGRYGAPRSFSVLKIAGQYVMVQGPTMDQVNASTEYYAGGHIHEVTYEQAIGLEAAGFDVTGF